MFPGKPIKTKEGDGFIIKSLSENSNKYEIQIIKKQGKQIIL